MKTSDLSASVNIQCEDIPCPLCASWKWESFACGFDYEYWTSGQKFFLVRCLDCGHIYLNPRPLPDQADKMYPFNYYTREGRHTRHSVIALLKRFVIRKRLAFFTPFLRREGMRILDVGCGDCALLTNLKKDFPLIQATGVDLEFANSAKEQCTILGIHLLEGRIEDVSLPQGTFDLVIMNQLLEHLWEPEYVIKKLHAAMKPGGYLSIETPNLDGYDRKLFCGSYWGGYYFPRHLNLFSFRSLKSFLERRNFKVVKQYSLLAPIIWDFSLHAVLAPSKDRQTRRVYARFFNDRNPFSLVIFSGLDCLAIAFKKITSNQKVIAQKI